MQNNVLRICRKLRWIRGARIAAGGHGVVAHYTRLDGQGGFLVQEASEDPAKDFEVTIQYSPWMTFEMFPATTIEDTFPVIQRVYG